MGTMVAVDVPRELAAAFEISLQAVTAPHAPEPRWFRGSMNGCTRSCARTPRGLALRFAPLVVGTFTERTSNDRVRPVAATELGARQQTASMVAPLGYRAGAVVHECGDCGPAGAGAQQRLAWPSAACAERAALIGRITDAARGSTPGLLTDSRRPRSGSSASGRLWRIDVRLAEGAAGAGRCGLRAQLPPDLELHATRAQGDETFAMRDAFTTNLKAMSLAGGLGRVLIYGAVSFAVLQRRAPSPCCGRWRYRGDVRRRAQRSGRAGVVGRASGGWAGDSDGVWWILHRPSMTCNSW